MIQVEQAIDDYLTQADDIRQTVSIRSDAVDIQIQKNQPIGWFFYICIHHEISDCALK